MVGNAKAPVSRPCTNDITQHNVGVVKRGDLDTLLGMRELGDQDWSTHLNKRGANSENNLAANEHIERGRKELNHDTSDDDDRPHRSRDTTTGDIADPTKEDERYNTSDGVGGTEEAKFGASGVSKAILPALEGLEGVGHGASQ